MVELVESNLHVEGLYKKPGASDKVSKLNKKLTKKKFGEIDKYKNDIFDICSCLKSYLQVHEPLVTRQVIEQIIKFCGKYNKSYLLRQTL